MRSEVRDYLEEVRSNLHLDPATERQILSELYSYFQEKVEELRGKGLSGKKASREAIDSLGRARELARLMYEAYSRGSLSEAFLSALPHLVTMLFFVLHLWRQPVLTLFALSVVISVTLYAWWHGKPNWMYSWVGYSLLPLMVLGYACHPVVEQAVSHFMGKGGALPSLWLLALIALLLVASAWTVIRTTIRVVRRDWVLASLMLAPLPIMATWMSHVEQMGSLFQPGFPALYQWDLSMAAVLTLLATASAIFIRLQRRALKIGGLLTLGVIAGTMAGNILWGNPGFFGLLGAGFLMLLFLTGPAVLEARIGHGEVKDENWWTGEWLRRPTEIR